ncbi:MAG: carboxypeptidase regulatory-like domain-containing protein [Acidobacteria bacterium]|nr:carboxypeptidase regulatory-like domain-containing protein [Acidobacteriota bacterium]
MRNVIEKFVGALVVGLLFAAAASAQVATGGSYTLNQAVVANGGGTSTDAVNNLYKVEGTTGQSAAGTFSTGGSYTTRGGFWAPNPFAPTAAGVNISGKILGVGGEGLRNITVLLTGGTLFTPRTARTNTFGGFTFEDVESGQVYTITVRSKKFGFPQESQVISVLDNVSDVVFQAGWEN